VYADEIFILAGDHVYAMRYDYMIAAHRNRRADITVGVIEIPLADLSKEIRRCLLQGYEVATLYSQ